MINKAFWEAPPWASGVNPWRLGLQPVAIGSVFTDPPDPSIIAHKQALLESQYEACVACAGMADPAQQALLDWLAQSAGVSNVARQFRDRIADVAAEREEDICLLDASDELRLVSACVCAPSYWGLAQKIGRPLRLIHAPVEGLDQWLGERIGSFFAGLPSHRAFCRRNWFIHGDNQRFHPVSEQTLATPPCDWWVRTERQVVFRLDARFVAFVIKVNCEPLAHIHGFPDALADLRMTLGSMHAGQIQYFGGVEKWRRLSEYVRSTSGRVSD